MVYHAYQGNDLRTNLIDELETVFKDLELGAKVVSADEVLEPMDIDEPGCANIPEAMDIDETECANIPETMDIDQETDVYMGDTKLDRSGNNTFTLSRHPIRRSECQFKKTAVYERKLAQVTFISERLIGQDPIRTFADNCEKTLLDWIALLRKTSLPDGITSNDPRIIDAFKAVDNVICGQGTALLQRLANVQLIRLFDAVKGIIKSDRDNRRIYREPYYRDDNIAMDLYLSAQETQSNMKGLRLKLKHGRKRFSKRWSDLATSSPLFVLVYSGAAEAIVYVLLPVGFPIG